MLFLPICPFFFRAGCCFDVDMREILLEMSGFQYFIVILVCTLGLGGNISYTCAMKFVSPTKGNVFRGLEVVTNYFIEIVWQGIPFTWFGPVGIACLFVAALLLPSEKTLKKAAPRWTEKYW